MYTPYGLLEEENIVKQNSEDVYNNKYETIDKLF